MTATLGLKELQHEVQHHHLGTANVDCKKILVAKFNPGVLNLFSGFVDHGLGVVHGDHPNVRAWAKGQQRQGTGTQRTTQVEGRARRAQVPGSHQSAHGQNQFVTRHRAADHVREYANHRLIKSEVHNLRLRCGKNLVAHGKSYVFGSLLPVNRLRAVAGSPG